MDLSEILAINGKSGLFKLISKGKNNFIVESFTTKNRMPAFSHDGVSSLDNISIFTEDEDVSLSDVFKAIYKKENKNKTPDIQKDKDKMRAYFEEVLPNFDKERVYNHNIKKILSWYDILLENGIFEELFNEEAPNNETVENIEAKEEDENMTISSE